MLELDSIRQKISPKGNTEETLEGYITFIMHQERISNGKDGCLQMLILQIHVLLKEKTNVCFPSQTITKKYVSFKHQASLQHN